MLAFFIKVKILFIFLLVRLVKTDTSTGPSRCDCPGVQGCFGIMGAIGWWRATIGGALKRLIKVINREDAGPRPQEK